MQKPNTDDITYAWSSSIRDGLVTHYREIVFHITERIHWMTGIAFLVFSLVFSNFGQFQKHYLIQTGAAIALLGCLAAIFILLSGITIFQNPFKKRPPGRDIFSSQTITQQHDKASLAQILAEIRTDSGKLDHVFAEALVVECQRMTEKKRVLKLGGGILFLSVLLGSILILLGYSLVN